jgi:hypothetical protein
LHLPFPYEIEPPDNPTDADFDKARFVEHWLSLREPLEKRASDQASFHLDKYSSEERDKLPERHLLGLAPAALRDCLPQLDVGDAFQDIGNPALLPAPEDPSPSGEGANRDREIREELINVLGGHTVLMSESSSNDRLPYMPWSLRYCGHQFGVWAGQLGDGRAISICGC